MGIQIEWQERYNIGVDIIDKEHKKLFSIINRLMKASEQEDKKQWLCEEGIKYFKDHAIKHFSEEEAYMASISYAGYESHRRVHDNFRQHTLPALEKELIQTNFSNDAVSHFLSVCAGWLIGHTLTEDRAITGKAENRWAHMMLEEETAVYKQLIIQQLNDMFQLETRLISTHYDGERFLKGIYYRLVYEKEKDSQLETILIFEEKLLLETLGRIMGSKAEKLNVELMNATRFMAKQFVGRIMEQLPEMDGYEVKYENLLTYDQFKRVFIKPQCSMLFDTGAGYFAYCVLQSGKKKTGASIKPDTAVSQVREYLDKSEKQNAQNQKKKILLVDDSDTIRLAMQKLLSEDYEISEANSGLGAIRCMTLDRPDLVLLDYEMPVCDGVQVLQMIRAEKEFADIPVFFLTGKVDKASVTRVMPLKPEGYLLKSQSPADIKRNIDGYFKKKKR